MKTKLQIEREIYADQDIIAKSQKDIVFAKQRIEAAREYLSRMPQVDATTESTAAPIIELRGKPYDSVCDDAIRDLTLTYGKFMRTNYYGMKIYSGFGPQRHDGKYGFGPRHGSIVGAIGFTDSFLSEERALTDAETQVCIDYIAAWRESTKAAA